MDFGYAHYMLSRKENHISVSEVVSPSTQAYRKRLAEACNLNERTRILAFKNKPPSRLQLIPKEILSSPPQSKPKPSIPKVITFFNFMLYNHILTICMLIICLS